MVDDSRSNFQSNKDVGQDYNCLDHYWVDPTYTPNRSLGSHMTIGRLLSDLNQTVGI